MSTGIDSTASSPSSEGDPAGRDARSGPAQAGRRSGSYTSAGVSCDPCARFCAIGTRRRRGKGPSLAAQWASRCPRGNASGTITRCRPPEELALTWEWAGTTSWGEVRLEPAPREGTVLRLEHIDHPREEFERQYGPGAGGVGWEISLVGLDLHLASPADAPTPGELESTWLKSEDGKAFVHGASEGWGAAAIAAGAPEVAAREAAQRTAEFYLQRAGA